MHVMRKELYSTQRMSFLIDLNKLIIETRKNKQPIGRHIRVKVGSHEFATNL